MGRDGGPGLGMIRRTSIQLIFRFLLGFTSIGDYVLLTPPYHATYVILSLGHDLRVSTIISPLPPVAPGKPPKPPGVAWLAGLECSGGFPPGDWPRGYLQHIIWRTSAVPWLFGLGPRVPLMVRDGPGMFWDGEG